MARLSLRGWGSSFTAHPARLCCGCYVSWCSWRHFLCCGQSLVSGPARLHRLRLTSVTWTFSSVLVSTLQPFSQHFLYFLPLPHGQGALRPIFAPWRRTVFTVISPVSSCASESVPRCSALYCPRRRGRTVSSSSTWVSS